MPADSPVVALAPARADALANLRADITRVIQQTRWRNDVWGVMVVSLTNGDTLFALEPDMPLAPASNMKLFTTAAALYYLGPRFRYNTFLLADGPLVEGTLQGDLVLYGTGDPTFSDRFGRGASVFEAFADTLLAHGIHEVSGDIVGDASYFRGSGTGLGWLETYIDASYAAPASALSFAENIATVRIEPADRAGWRPAIRLIPGGEGIAIVNQATTVQRGSTSLRAARSTYGGPLAVTGRISSRSRGVVRSVPVSDPPRYAAAVLREILVKRGIVVGGGVRAVHDETGSPVTGRSVFAPAFDRRQPLRVLAVHESPPLLDVLTVINKRSHNLYAEQALRTVGRVATGEGSAAGGAHALLHFISREASIDTTAMRVLDGSGLSPLNRVTARSLIQLLAYMAESTMADDYFVTLPEAGAIDGLQRMQRTPAQGNLRAKTGTLANVSALSGYVRAENGEQLAFAIVANNVPSTWRAKRVEDAIGARLARFSRDDPGQH
jgi:D-alanyl-D-alanine carboxypeptidase/D-alanyl-D-alanine-endopeptidase (penicillin-binding protein 4)